MNMVWHYAPWAYLPKIVECGYLKASNAGAPHKPALLWFSKNQHWEPTATKFVGNEHGPTGRLTFKQQVELFGCIRFGLPTSDPRLMDWKTACKFDGTGRDERRRMEIVGKKDGGNPEHWFAIGADVLISELLFHVWLSNQWYNAAGELEDYAKVWLNRDK